MRLRFLALLTVFGLAACDQTTQTADSEDTTQAAPVGTPSTAVSSQPTLIALPNIDKSNPDWKRSLEKPELMTFDPARSYIWIMSTNHGEMRFRLNPTEAPMHVTSTIYLTELGFYDGVIFHRVIPGFMAQGGDPTGTGSGGPGYKYDGEFSGTVSHDRPGLLSMANAGPGTDGSQFFITFVPTQYLDGKHTIFGELIQGEETLAALEARGSRSGQTSEQLIINKATISVE